MEEFTEEGKEQIFDIIEEYEKLKHEKVGIRFTIEFKEEGLIFLVGYEHTCQNGTYWISKLVQRKLDKTKIKYEMVR